MKRHTANGVLTLTIILLSFHAGMAAADSALPAQTHPGQAGLSKAARLAKASTPLLRVIDEYRDHAARGRRTEFTPSDRFLLFSAGRVLVEARAATDGAELFAALERLGLQNGHRHRDLVSGMLPVAAIEQAAALSSLRSIAAAIAPIRNAGSITSQGDIALRAVDGRAAYGVDGSGVSVGIVSDSFDALGGAAADVISGDLPAGVQVIGGESPYCGTVVACIDEGRAMAQIVHDMAPGASLLFHTGFATKAEYANAILSLAAAGADVIVDDLLYLNEPMFQDGVVAQAVDSVAADGVAYFAAAGNAGDASYQAAFDDSGEIFCIEFFLPIGDCDPIFERVGRMHDFDPGPGVDLYQSVTVPINGVLTVALQWDQPFGGPGVQSDHDIVLLDQTGGVYFEISANDNVVTGEGWEVLQFFNHEFVGYGTSFNLIITYDDVDSVNSQNPPPTLLKMVVFGSGNTLNEHQTDSATLYGHANAAGATAVGAAFFAETPAFGVAPPQLEPYSSRGGTPIVFSADGAPLGAAVIRAKPEITAVDGVNTTFFFDDSHGSDGIDDFFGTSAAAPHAAGVAALLLQARPGSSPQQVTAALESSAIDMNTPGFDHDSGYGLMQADAALAALLAVGGNNPPLADFSYVVNDLGVTFTDASTDSDGSIVARNWNFGDGATSTVANPSHSYAAAGTYTVALTVTDDAGDSDTASQQVTVTAPVVNLPPVADFSYVVNDLGVTFTDASTDSDGSILARNWDFGDGATSTVANPSHSYAAAGTYTVALMVTDDAGDSDTASQQVTVTAPVVNLPPVAAFAYTCNGRECAFDSAASSDDAGIISYFWDFGDGSGSEAPSLMHSYQANGTYTVTLTVTDAEGASDSASVSIRIKNRGIISGSTDGGTDVSEKGRKKCTDGVDNDGDGLVDAADPDCR